MKSAKEKALNSMPEGVLGLQPLVHKALDIAIKEAKREEAKKWQQKIRQLEKYETENVLKAKREKAKEMFGDSWLELIANINNLIWGFSSTIASSVNEELKSFQQKHKIK